MVTGVTYRNLFCCVSNLYEFLGYRTKSVAVNADGTS